MLAPETPVHRPGLLRASAGASMSLDVAPAVSNPTVVADVALAATGSSE